MFFKNKLLVPLYYVIGVGTFRFEPSLSENRIDP